MTAPTTTAATVQRDLMETFRYVAARAHAALAHEHDAAFTAKAAEDIAVAISQHAAAQRTQSTGMPANTPDQQASPEAEEFVIDRLAGCRQALAESAERMQRIMGGSMPATREAQRSYGAGQTGGER